MSVSALSFIWNEAQNIDKCLSAIRPYVDEMLIIDLQSTDDTVKLCQKYTDQVYVRPYLLCGDFYKAELVHRAKGDWLLWFYPDELWIQKTMEALVKLSSANTKWNAFAFMRREYMDGVRIAFFQDGKRTEFGTPECPNWQNRLHKNDGRIFYTEFVHAELHGEYEVGPAPSEYYFEHHKTSRDQEFDNARFYIYYQVLTWKYGNTSLEPYKKYVDSYRKIISDSEKKNLSGDRKILLAEEFWWEWWKYFDLPRVTLEEFEKLVGMTYEKFLLEKSKNSSIKTILIQEGVKDEIFKSMEER